MKIEKNRIFQQLLLPMTGISLPQTSLHLFCQSKPQELEEGQGTQRLPRQGGTAQICSLLMAQSWKDGWQAQETLTLAQSQQKIASKATLLHKDQ